MESQDKDVVSEGLGSISVYDQWVAPPVSGLQPKPRYEVLGYYCGLFSLFSLYAFPSIQMVGYTSLDVPSFSLCNAVVKVEF